MVLLLDNRHTGPAGRFTDADVLFALEILAEEKHIGRSRLSAHLGIGEGSARTLIDVLEKEGLVSVTRAGVSLSPDGRCLLTALGVRSVDVHIPAYVLGKYQQGVVVEDAAERVFNGIDQRNTGIRAGGDGCTTWILDERYHVIMLPNWDMDVHDPRVAEEIRRATGMRPGDVLIIGGGETPRYAMMAAGEASLELVRPRRSSPTSSPPKKFSWAMA